MRVEGLNPTQIGTVGQLRFVTLAILGSGGALELVPPLADDERRDFEIHLRHGFGATLSVQVRVMASLWRPGLLYVEFGRDTKPPIDRAYWYFVAYLDLAILDFADPVFLIPSTALHKGPWQIGRAYLSLEPGSKDQWAPYRVTRWELGMRLRTVLKSLAEVRKGA